MKSCIGFVIDLSRHTKKQLSNLKVEIEGDSIATFLPFMNLLSNMIDEKFDIFVGSCGVDISHGKVCDIILLLQFLSNHEFLPIVEKPSNNSRVFKNQFIKKLRDAGAVEISKVAECQLTEYHCKYLLSAFQNYPNIYYEIGFEEYRKFHEKDSKEYFKIYPQAKPAKSDIGPGSLLLLMFFPILGIPKIIGDAVHNRDMLTYGNLISHQYNLLSNKVLFSALRQYDWKTYPRQFLLCSSNEIMNIISNLYKRIPPNCQNSIIDGFVIKCCL